ncbi:MAG: alkaline phosphatase family protein [Bacteroidales bacterium]
MNRIFFKPRSCISIFIIGFLLTGLFYNGCKVPLKEPSASMVVLIGIDGLSTLGFQEAETPNIDQLVRRGALSLSTRAVIPSISAPNWASHLTGALPQQHGVTFNGWTRENSLIRPAETDEEGFYPSVFTVIRQEKPAAKTGFFYDWDDLADLFNTEHIDHAEYSEDWTTTLEKAAPWILENRPDFTFIYIGYPDEVGHEYRWGSNKYLQAIEEVDKAIGDLFSRFKEVEIFDQIHFLLVSDHGGRNYGHGGFSPEEIEVPWMIAGPGIIRDRMIGQPGHVFNTAATIIRLLSLEQPDSWVGEPVYGAFEGSPGASVNLTKYVPQPISSKESGIYTVSDTLSFTVKPADLTIRFTLNGEDPDLNSPVYSNPVLLLRNTVVKAAAFIGEHRSRVTTVDFMIVKAFRSIELTHPPSLRYAGKGPFALADQEIGSYDFRDGRWLGFEGVDLHASIMLNEMTDVSEVMIGYMNNPDSWIFAPEHISVMGSVDGQNYINLGALDEAQISSQSRKGRNRVTIRLQPSKLRYLKVYMANAGVCPRGHPGEGEPAWLFVDEIMVQ